MTVQRGLATVGIILAALVGMYGISIVVLFRDFPTAGPCALTREGQDVRIEGWAWSHLGMRCTFTTRSGGTTVRYQRLPW
ncbi:MAG: hypothetical protein QOE83_2456 [Actinomycetota bacterium]|jgi:hypothetical protein|nr:hypothetical protein [Actinomycetota bacterium]